MENTQQQHVRRLLRNGPRMLTFSAVFLVLGMIFSHSPPALPLIFCCAGVLHLKSLLLDCQTGNSKWANYFVICIPILTVAGLNYMPAAEWWKTLLTISYWQACYAGTISLLLALFREQFSRFVDTTSEPGFNAVR